ncbi:MAG: hypothetical protein MZV49_12575 [Rhodopseudomonas palustris]|nr:hypothetical protein [Rhodopseudomonas palustris]
MQESTAPNIRSPGPRPPGSAGARCGQHAERGRALPMPSLEWTPEVERATAHLSMSASRT